MVNVRESSQHQDYRRSLSHDRSSRLFGDPISPEIIHPLKKNWTKGQPSLISSCVSRLIGFLEGCPHLLMFNESPCIAAASRLATGTLLSSAADNVKRRLQP